MDYGRLLNRAWNVIWNKKYLILLGVLAALSSSGGGSGAVTSSQWNLGQLGEWEAPDVQVVPRIPDALLSQAPRMVILGVLAVGAALVIGALLWGVSTLARGGLIAGVDAIERDQAASFQQSMSAAWDRKWALWLIGLLPALPGLLLALSAVAGVGLYAGMGTGRVINGPQLGLPNATLVAVLGGLACLAIPVGLVLSLLRTFANRACMMEGLGAWEAYRRGLQVLGEQLGSALILFLIQVVASIVVGILIVVPSMLMALCCIGWPVLLLIQGTIAAFFSAMWTLAWHEWTGRGSKRAANPA